MRRIKELGFVILSVSILLIGVNGCGKKQIKGSEPIGRAGIQGAVGSTDPYLKPIYFDYDQYAISDNQKQSLDAAADHLKKNPNLKVQLEGHTDERGTNEYNQGLGDRRASNVKKYLTDLGVSSSRISTVSYGEERPASNGSNDSAWSKNRRAEFAVTSSK
jgi:peptidoglycan-associated lipoprotein